jgi:hypothetical protein
MNIIKIKTSTLEEWTAGRRGDTDRSRELVSHDAHEKDAAK